MLIKTLNRIITNVAGKASLRTVLIVPFVLQIVGAVGLVGYLSFRNGQQAVNDVASQLQGEISDRIEQNLRTYLTTPFQILQTNQDVIAQGMLNVKNLQPWELYLWRQGNLYNRTSVIGVGNEQGNYQDIERFNDRGKLALNVSDKSTSYNFQTYSTNSKGKRIGLIRNKKNYDPRKRPWYQAAVKAGKPTWSEIYANIDRQTLGIAAVHPVYDLNNRLEGVLVVTQWLNEVSEYLQKLKIGRTGKAFILERSGMLVATSIAQMPFQKNNDKVERLRALDSSDTLIQATAKYLSNRFSDLKQIQGSQQLEFEFDGKRQFLQLLSFQDSQGLDWVIVVVVPESDFMERINTNTYTTILLCVATLIVSTGIGIFILRWITKPILSLNTAAKEIAQGKLDKTVEINRSDEVGQLAKSFNKMAGQLQKSFAALKESENRLTQFLEALPVGVSVHDVTGKMSYANPISKQLIGIDTLPDATTEELATAYRVYLSGTEQPYPVEQMPVVKALLGENSTVEDMELHRPDRIIPLEVRATPIYNEKGEIVSAISAFTDITERKQAQQILADYNHTLEAQVVERTAELMDINEQLKREIVERQRAEAEIIRYKKLLESIFNESADAIFIVNAETLLITDCNRRAVELFEAQSKEELLNTEGRTLQKESFTEEELQFIVDEIELYGFWSLELEYVTKKGKLFWGNLAAREINVADQKMHLVRVTDITARKQSEEALRESKRFIERIVNASPHLWYIYDHIEQRNIYANRELAAVLGYTPEEMEAMGSALLPTIVHPDDLARFPAHLKQWETATDDDILEIDYRIRNAQGEWRTLLTLESVFERTPDGKVKQVIGTSTDISERKQAEKVLRENALREQAIAHVLQRMRQKLAIDAILGAATQELRQVLNCDRVAIYRFNPDWSGEFVAESVAHGWVPLVVKQKNDPSLTEDVVEDENCTIKTLNENDLVQDTYLQETQGGPYTKGISYRAVEDIYNAGFTPCYINILERFQAKAYINVPIFYGSKLWGLLATYQNSGSRSWSEAEISVVVQIGTQMGIALQQAELLEETKQQAVALKLAFDELKRTQTQLIQAEKMSSLGQMVAGIAHEINNPVSFIYGNITPAHQYFQDLLELLKLYQQTYPNSTEEIEALVEEIDLEFLVEDWSKLMDSMQVGAQRIRDIVLSLRNFSRLDEKELKPVDIHEGIENTLLILQHRLRAEGHRPAIEVVKNYGELPLVTCYASQLNQVFMNILSNAIDALENQPEPRKLTICTSLINQEATSPIAQFIVIKIADNGSGMTEEVRQKIFDPFFTTKPVGSGTGLGLSISYQIVVEKHKGQISCISAPGQETEFIVEIPVEFTTVSASPLFKGG